MNALIALTKGKVVLSGNEKETEELLEEKSPVINIKPDVEDIFNKLENLVLNPNEISALGQRSYDFVKEVHDNVKVSKLYLNSWMKTHR